MVHIYMCAYLNSSVILQKYTQKSFKQPTAIAHFTLLHTLTLCQNNVSSYKQFQNKNKFYLPGSPHLIKAFLCSSMIRMSHPIAGIPTFLQVILFSLYGNVCSGICWVPMDIHIVFLYVELENSTIRQRARCKSDKERCILSATLPTTHNHLYSRYICI